MIEKLEALEGGKMTNARDKTMKLTIPKYRVELVCDGGLKTKAKVCDPLTAARIARAYIGRVAKEHFIDLLLNSQREILGINTVSIGTLTASLVHPREVFQPALLAGAAGVIVVHNHPSGNEEPSIEDKETTRRLKRAGELLGIPVVDHIILGEGAHFSFKDAGLL